MTLADRSITCPYGVLEDVLVRMNDFLFPLDFVILDMPKEFETPLLLGNPFLAIGRPLVDLELSRLIYEIQKIKTCFQRE